MFEFFSPAHLDMIVSSLGISVCQKGMLTVFLELVVDRLN